MMHISKEDLAKVSTKALDILLKHKVIEYRPEQEVLDREVSQMAAAEYFLPLEILSMEALGLSYFDVDTFDDSQRYQDEDYYRNRLEKLSKASSGRISFSAIEAQWEGNVIKLSLEFNGFSQVLEFDVSEEEDMVPEPFVAFQLELLKRDIDGWTFVLGSAHEAASRYYSVPVSAARELEALEAGSVKK